MRRHVGRGERALYRLRLEPEHPCDRDNAARALGVAPAQVRFVAPDVGGGFGAKNFIYAEHVLMLWAARRVGRPVKWIASRSEVFLADHQARDQQAEGALALDAEGRFLALRVASAANLGAYLRAAAAACRPSSTSHLPGHGLPHPGDRAASSRAC